MELFDIVMKLTGPIYPIGEHNADQARLQNMKKLAALVDRLLLEIRSVVPNADRSESSMKAVGLYAKEFMKDVHDQYDGDL